MLLPWIVHADEYARQGRGSTANSWRHRARGRNPHLGAKNATLPILAGCLLAAGPVTVSTGLVTCSDVTTRSSLLGLIGVSLTIDEKMHIRSTPPPSRIFRSLPSGEEHARLDPGTGTLFGAFGAADVSLPGGLCIAPFR